MFIIAKDKIIGLVIMLVGVLMAILYTMGSLIDLLMYSAQETNEIVGLDLTTAIFGMDLFDWRLFVVLPLWLIVVLISIIAIWIGYSMLTTPAPVPLEELEEELAAEEAKGA